MQKMQQQSLGTTERAEMLQQSAERAEMLRSVQEQQFAMRDLAIYLDTHPTDAEALRQFMARAQDYQHCADQFAQRFGALHQKQVNGTDGWAAWSNTPWPWEKEAN